MKVLVVHVIFISRLFFYKDINNFVKKIFINLASYKFHLSYIPESV